MSGYAVPFNKVSTGQEELSFILQALQNGHLSGDGPFTKQCELLLENAVGVERALLTTSCTDALEMAALLLDIRPGDEVIAPAFTFVTTINSFVTHGATPVFVDVRPDTLNLDEKRLEAAITPRTKAIVPVHYAGVGCEMDGILDIANRHGVAVVEDNAHGLFGRYKGQMLGTFGSLATQSFHATKNFTSGEGGALLINDSRYVQRAEILREKGTNRSNFVRGQVDKYTWVDVGSSFLPSDLLAALLLAQLERRTEIQAKRATIWERYNEGLADWASEQGVGLPYIPEHCEQAYHLFYLMMPTARHRDRIIDHLHARGIQSVFHFQPLHISDMGRRLGGESESCPVAEDISERLVRVPFFTDLSAADQALVLEAIRDFRC